ncbi:DUF6777 domain-containing protein [Streptomyces sp. NPDC007905]|uniref:DUF6777 domain-containing protein n=1 Tax=Streptomyces sp. NPDC007905 TaxID=3364788 RepID=UPI0036E2B42B
MRRPRRIPAESLVTAWALSTAILVAGCVGDTVKAVGPQSVVFLQPAAVPGPDPFTGPTATTAPATRAAQSPLPVARDPAPPHLPRVFSGAIPGLYGGTAHAAGCDVERQIGHLAADRAKGDAFARVAGVPRASLPRYLRGLTPVVLRTDTSVTNHSYVEHRATGFQSVLQAGTAVLVDARGVPRVRCLCGNPLTPPQPLSGAPSTRGTAWPGYRPTEVIVVTPGPRALTDITLFDTATGTWIARRIGPDVHHDRVVPAPAPATLFPGNTEPARTAQQSPHEGLPGVSSGETGRAPGGAAPAVA